LVTNWKNIEISFQSPFFRPTIVNTYNSLKPGESEEVNINLEKRPDVYEEDYPGEVEFQYVIGRIIRRGAITLGTGFMRGDFETPYPVNVLFFGMKGSGKSSLANTIMFCLSRCNNVSAKVLLQLEQTDHVTKNYQKVWIGEKLKDNDDVNQYFEELNESKEKIKICLFDPWGDSDSDYDKVTIKQLIDGQIPPGTHRDEVVSKLRPKTISDQIHCVVFIIPLSSIDDDFTMTQFLARIKMVTDVMIQPLVVVTRIDDLENITTREAYMKRMLQSLPLQEANVFFHQNYHKHTHRDVKIDLSTRRILKAILLSWSNSIQKIQKVINKVNWNLETILTDVPLDPIYEMDLEVKCISCNKPLEGENKKFCGSCGTPQQLLCLECKTPYSPGTSFCGNCGAKVGDKKPKILSHCGREYKEGTKFCQECGTKF